MPYYIGCAIPRGSDCDEHCKCLSGVFCGALEILNTDNYRSSFRYGGSDCEMFEKEEDAKALLLQIAARPKEI